MRLLMPGSSAASIHKPRLIVAAVGTVGAGVAVGTGSELLGELLLLGDGVLDSLLLRGDVVLILLLLGGDELFVLLLLGLHELLALGLSLVEGLLLGLTHLLDLLGGHAVGAIGVRARVAVAVAVGAV